jgi:hypothetical protein
MWDGAVTSPVMDRKTEELRDIFMDVADDGTVTESQEESRGSLTDRPDVDEAVAEVVGQIRERYDLATDLDDDALVTVVRCVFEGHDDDAIAAELADPDGKSAEDGSSDPAAAVDADTVFEARMDLHLVRDEDLPESEDALEAIREHREAGVDAVADALDVDEATAGRYVRALETQERSRAANDRYRDAFAAVLTDADLATDLDTAREDGLDDATEDVEVDVDF